MTTARIETKLLSAIIAAKQDFKQPIEKAIAAGLSADDFESVKHRLWWDAIASLTAEDKPVCPATVQDWMETAGTFKRAGGSKFLTAAMTGAGKIDVEKDFKMLREESANRRYLAEKSKIDEAMKAPGADIAKLSAQLDELGDRFRGELNGAGVMSPREREKFEINKELQILSQDDRTAQLLGLRDMSARYRIKTIDLEERMHTLSFQAEQSNYRTLTCAELLALKPKKIDYLVPDFLPRGEAILLASAAGVGKTNIVTAMMESLIAGGTFLGKPVQGGKKILYISADESEQTMARRAEEAGIKDAIEDHLAGKGLATDVQYWFSHQAENRERLREYLEDYRPDVVVMDSLSTIFGDTGKSTQNDARFGILLKAVIGDCEMFGSSLVVVHHNSKKESSNPLDQVAGSHQIPARFWGVFGLSRVNPKDQSDQNRTLKMLKGREIQEWSVNIKINPRDLWLQEGIYSMVETEEEIKLSGQRDRLLRTLKESGSSMCSREVAERSGVPVSSVYRLLGQLESAGEIWRDRAPRGKTWFYGVHGIHAPISSLAVLPAAVPAVAPVESSVAENETIVEAVQEFETVAETVAETVEVEAIVVEPESAAQTLAATIVEANPQERWDIVRALDATNLMDAFDYISDDSVIEEVIILAGEHCEGFKVGDRAVYEPFKGQSDEKQSIKDFGLEATYGKSCEVKSWYYDRPNAASRAAGFTESAWELIVVFDDKTERNTFAAALTKTHATADNVL